MYQRGDLKISISCSKCYTHGDEDIYIHNRLPQASIHVYDLTQDQWMACGDLPTQKCTLALVNCMHFLLEKVIAASTLCA